MKLLGNSGGYASLLQRSNAIFKVPVTIVLTCRSIIRRNHRNMRCYDRNRDLCACAVLVSDEISVLSRKRGQHPSLQRTVYSSGILKIRVQSPNISLARTCRFLPLIIKIVDRCSWRRIEAVENFPISALDSRSRKQKERVN